MASGPRIRVLSYNVHGLHDDRDALRTVVRAARPDVAILQEAPRRLRWRTKSAILASEFGLVVAGGGLPALGNLILANLRVRVHEQWCVQFPLTPGRHMRGAAFVRCSVARVPFVVGGSHLATDATERPGQATILKKTMADVDAALILGADLNEKPGGPAWRVLGEGLTDAGLPGGPTFPASGPRDRIDAILVDPRCDVLGYEVISTPEARRASDHLPLLVEVALPEV
jgi:endonuclease/exonuclease/phosphatase family metal-dependent hydrolase